MNVRQKLQTEGNAVAERLDTPPGFIAPGLTPPQALDKHVGGFSFEPGGDFATIRDAGREWYVTPVDRRTGIPYPILQHEYLPKNNPYITNVHHARHPENLLIVQDSLFPDDPSPLARLAERNACLQLVNAIDHNRVDPVTGDPTYHDNFFGPIPLRTEAEIFKYVVSAVAGIFPKYALDIRGGEPKIVVPTAAQLEQMRAVAKPQPIHRRKLIRKEYKAGDEYRTLDNPILSREDYVQRKLDEYKFQHESNSGFSYVHFGYRYDVVRHFISECIFKQDINVEDSYLDRFMEAKDQKIRLSLGKTLLSMAIDAATLDVAKTYNQARKHGVIHPRLPKTARGVVWTLFATPAQRYKLTNQLGESLAAAR
jgi:hypothetical protein